MRDPGEVSVQRAIVHLVRRRETGGLVVSEAEVDLNKNKRFGAFLGIHIRNSLEDEDARTAKFDKARGEGTGTVAAAAIDVLGEDADSAALLSSSSLVAKALHEVIEAQKSTSECALVCCTYVAAKDGRDAFLALLKLDPSGAFRPRATERRGLTVVDMEELRDVLPSERERLQKAALIRKPKPRLPFDLMVLDRQQRGRREPAEYFMAFLGCSFALDSLTATRSFYTSMYVGLREARPHLSDDEQQLVSTALHTALRTERVNPGELIAGLRIPQEAKNILAARVRDAVQDRAFRPDPQVADRLTKYRAFRGSHDVMLKMSSEASRDESILRVERKAGAWIVTLRLEHWEEVPR